MYLLLLLQSDTKKQVTTYNAGVHFFSRKTDRLCRGCLLRNAVKLTQKDQQKCKITLIFQQTF